MVSAQDFRFPYGPPHMGFFYGHGLEHSNYQHMPGFLEQVIWFHLLMDIYGFAAAEQHIYIAWLWTLPEQTTLLSPLGLYIWILYAFHGFLYGSALYPITSYCLMDCFIWCC